MKKITYILVVILFSRCLFAEPAEKDSVKTYRLGEIITTAVKDKTDLTPSTVSNIPYYKIQATDAQSVSDLGLYMPASRIQTNSRGETLLYLRGSGERQISLYFDGVPVNQQWDNRMDLSFIPSDLIGNISVNKGAASILYGSNILGGAVNISTIERANEGIGSVVRFQVNDANSKYLSVTNDARNGSLNYVANISYLKSDGFLIPDEAKDFLHQDKNSNLRTNTDMERMSAYLRTEYHFSDMTTAGLSINNVNAKKGVAPVGYLQDNVRFWRYPEWKRTLITLNGEHKFSRDGNDRLRAVFWYDNNFQKIDYYEDITYSNVESSERLDGSTFGTRLSFQMEPFDGHYLTAAFNGYSAVNNFDSDEEGIFDYLEDNFSTGLEYKGLFGSFLLTAGGTLDGDIVSKESGSNVIDDETITDYGAIFGVRFYAADDLSLFTSILRRTRFPTLREKYSTGGGKFDLNPGLGAESGILTEFGADAELGMLKLNAAVFFNNYDDLISQIRTETSRMRVNLDKARIYGLELSAYYSPLLNLRLEGYFTYMQAEQEVDGEWIDELEYKPKYIGSLIAGYETGFGLRPQIEAEFTGLQKAQDENTGVWVDIDPTTIVNLRLSYRNTLSEGIFPEFFIRVNNIFNTYKLSKLGLPDPGRMFTMGVIASI